MKMLEFINLFLGDHNAFLGEGKLSSSNLWQNVPMKISEKYSLRLEDRKALKLMERLKSLVLRAKPRSAA